MHNLKLTDMEKRLLWMLTSILTCGLTITSCSNNDTPSSPTDEVEAQLAKMTLREKVGQMFFVRMETLDTTIHWNAYSDLQDNPILEVNKTMRDVNANYPIGGLILYAWNIDDEAQLAKLIPQIRALNGNPLLCIDEEGGRVSRLANNPKFNVKKYESMAAIGATGDPNNAYERLCTCCRCEHQSREHHYRPPCFQRRPSGGCADGDQLSARPEGCWYHRLYQALPRSR